MALNGMLNGEQNVSTQVYLRVSYSGSVLPMSHSGGLSVQGCRFNLCHVHASLITAPFNLCHVHAFLITAPQPCRLNSHSGPHMCEQPEEVPS